MPTAPDDRRRVIVLAEGPILVEGPVEIVTPDGGTVGSDRVLVAIGTCRRSHRYPLCDTSHRKRQRTTEPSGQRSA